MPAPLVLSTSNLFFTDPGTQELHAAEGFGITNSGTAYFCPDGATPGEAAWVRLRNSGTVVLMRGEPSLMFGLIHQEGERAPSIRLPVMTVGRPVDLPAAQTLKQRRRTGKKRPTAPHAKHQPSTEAGRPVRVADPETAALRHGRPVEVSEPETAQLRRGRPVALGEAQTLPLRSGRPVELPEPQTLDHVK